MCIALSSPPSPEAEMMTTSAVEGAGRRACLYGVDDVEFRYMCDCDCLSYILSLETKLKQIQEKLVQTMHSLIHSLTYPVSQQNSCGISV